MTFDLVAGVEHRRGGAGPDRRDHQRPGRAQRRHRGVHAVRRGQVDRDAQRRAGPLQERPHGRGQRHRPAVRGDPVQRPHQPGDGVLVVRARAVPGPAPRGQAQVRRPALGRPDRVQVHVPAVGGGHVVGVAARLADRGRTAVEQLRVLGDQPVRAPVPAVLLVGDEREHQLTPRPHPAGEGGQHHRHEVLHVGRAAAPQVAVAHLAGERRHRPVRGVRRDDVQVPLHQQRRQRRVRARHARDDAGPPGRRLDDPRRDAQAVEERRHVLRGRALALGVVPAAVGRVEPDQVRAQLDDVSHRCPAPPPPRSP